MVGSRHLMSAMAPIPAEPRTFQQVSEVPLAAMNLRPLS